MASALRSPEWFAALGQPGRYVCQDCNPQRKRENQGEKTLRVTLDDKGARGHCHHCGSSFIWTYGYQEKSMTQIAEPNFVTSDRLDDHGPLNQRALSYLAERGISEETAKVYGLVSGERQFRQRKNLPGGRLEGIGFPYSQDGQRYAIKWRAITEKNFTQDGSASTLFGPPLPAGQPLCITEGEGDALSIHTATGIVAKSIPSGADENASPNTRMSFLDKSYAEVKAAAKVILFLDDDVPGKAMAAEIARRIGRNKVWRVSPPAGCKDANDVLVQHGPDTLRQLVDNAEPWPIEGLIRPSDIRSTIVNLHKNGMPPGRSTGLRSLDQHLTIQTGMLYILTGKPGGGKSTFLDNVMVNLSNKFGWRWAVASFESPVELNVARLASIRMSFPFADLTDEQLSENIDWMEDHFSFLTSDGLVSIESVIDRATAAVTRFGVKGLIIDPYNYIRNKDEEMDTEQVNRILSSLKAFAVAMDVAVFLVAHPSKPSNGDSDQWVPTGYSVSGSAHFYNRADFGITVTKAAGADEMQGDSLVAIWKCKWRHLGKEGRVFLNFDPATERFFDKRTLLDYEMDQMRRSVMAPPPEFDWGEDPGF